MGSTTASPVPFTDPTQPRLYSTSQSPSLDAFRQTCSQQATKTQYPHASTIQNNIPIYNLPPYGTLTPQEKKDLQDEWYAVLLHGPGVFVTKNLYSDHVLLDDVNAVFRSIIAEEKETMTSHGDHFAGAGKNDRIWNAFSKHGLADPRSFLKYYSNPYLGLIAASWLGPGYRITAQVNNVKPGAAAQVSHRDYHLGFMSAETCSQIPRAMQVSSQFLTLQGAVAHIDVPMESGPTRLLPFSQTFAEGYMAYRLPEFNDYFLKNYVSLPLAQGDGLFFNPALFHAAGTNQSQDIERMANLLQISSAFGKPMESIDAIPLVEAVWDQLLAVFQSQGTTDAVKAFVEAVGEGYAFPTNLDRNPPQSDSMAPKCEQDVLWDCLQRGCSMQETSGALKAYRTATAA
ncbi:phytanoyl- dioxygenase family protein [Pochonia chlamydosporia 170]|uniref:Phytanoyl- dioxygenase family protein n=1 Tax=Pochonia chlamydosporia 170 TaxID=1380566 RepID=A0A179F5B0_METCM|nr:phytanoyl- dioxygenase family protein [Pochonia chlamydosporia 170]OAQ60592.1 phytanoyl- dioxygenase family protein [Pochonia chlamydosporia 170]